MYTYAPSGLVNFCEEELFNLKTGVSGPVARSRVAFAGGALRGSLAALMVQVVVLARCAPPSKLS